MLFFELMREGFPFVLYYPIQFMLHGISTHVVFQCVALLMIQKRFTLKYLVLSLFIFQHVESAQIVRGSWNFGAIGPPPLMVVTFVVSVLRIDY